MNEFTGNLEQFDAGDCYFDSADVVFDTIVIGAGPGGSSAAISLARNAKKVALVEALHLPHSKVCGEFLSPECTDLLTALGMLDAICSLGPARFDSVMFTTPGHSVWNIDLPQPGYGLSRRALDATLARGAVAHGARLFMGTRVDAIEGNAASGFAVHTTRGTLLGRTVIAAHGKRSQIDRLLRRDFISQRQPFMALKTHIDGHTLQGKVEMHLFPGGYCGLAATEDRKINVCLLVEEPIFQKTRGKSENAVGQFLKWMLSQNEHLKMAIPEALFHADWETIAQIPFASKPTTERGILMVGDAAGVIPPIVGDGIAIALESGIAAATVISEFIDGRLSFKQMGDSYTTHWRKAFSRRYQWARLLQRLALNPPAADLSFRILRYAPPVASHLLALTRSPVGLNAPNP